MARLQSMTPRERMLAAYRGEFSDTVAVAPEFWYYIPARLLGLSMIEFEMDVPQWQALQATFSHYGCEGWGIVSPEKPNDYSGREHCQTKWIDEDRLEVVTVLESAGHRLQSRRIVDAHNPSWLVERYIKDFEQDWPVYEGMTLIPANELDWRPVQVPLDSVGDDYLLEVNVGVPFVDFVGGQREGGFEQVIVDLMEREGYLQPLLERYVEHMGEKVRATFANTTATSVFVGSGWSSLSLLSPSIWRRWERPVLVAVVEAAHDCGGLMHHHFHGKCMGVLPELVALGIDCICPFERPPGGDVTDLKEVKHILADRTTFNGNVHTVETLIRGTPGDVRREVLEILEAFSGSSRLIVGTGDQVGMETPDENIFAMIETVGRYGKR